MHLGRAPNQQGYAKRTASGRLTAPATYLQRCALRGFVCMCTKFYAFFRRLKYCALVVSAKNADEESTCTGRVKAVKGGSRNSQEFLVAAPGMPHSLLRGRGYAEFLCANVATTRLAGGAGADEQTFGRHSDTDCGFSLLLAHNGRTRPLDRFWVNSIGEGFNLLRHERLVPLPNHVSILEGRPRLHSAPV